MSGKKGSGISFIETEKDQSKEFYPAWEDNSISFDENVTPEMNISKKNARFEENGKIRDPKLESIKEAEAAEDEHSRQLSNPANHSGENSNKFSTKVSVFKKKNN